MPLYFYLLAYLFFSSLVTYLFSCTCGMSEPFPDRRKTERRKTPRAGSIDRRQSVNYRFKTEGYPVSPSQTQKTPLLYQQTLSETPDPIEIH